MCLTLLENLVFILSESAVCSWFDCGWSQLQADLFHPSRGFQKDLATTSKSKYCINWKKCQNKALVQGKLQMNIIISTLEFYSLRLWGKAFKYASFAFLHFM